MQVLAIRRGKEQKGLTVTFHPNPDVVRRLIPQIYANYGLKKGPSSLLSSTLTGTTTANSKVKERKVEQPAHFSRD